MKNIYFESIFNPEDDSYEKFESGDLILIDYGKGETYKAIIAGENIRYENRKEDSLLDIMGLAVGGECKVSHVKKFKKKRNGVVYCLSFKTKDDPAVLSLCTFTKEYWEKDVRKAAVTLFEICGPKSKKLITGV